mgnify:CR=1 FL=1
MGVWKIKRGWNTKTHDSSEMHDALVLDCTRRSHVVFFMKMFLGWFLVFVVVVIVTFKNGMTCMSEEMKQRHYPHISKIYMYLWAYLLISLLLHLSFPPALQSLLFRNPGAGRDSAALTWCGKCCRCCFCCSCCCLFFCVCVSVFVLCHLPRTETLLTHMPFACSLSVFLYIYTHFSPPPRPLIPLSLFLSLSFTLFGPTPILLTHGQTSLASCN